MPNQLMPLIGKKLAVGASKYFLVKVTGHKNNNVMNIMELGTGKVATRTLYHTGKAVDTFSKNPKRVATALKAISMLVEK